MLLGIKDGAETHRCEGLQRSLATADPFRRELVDSHWLSGLGRRVSQANGRKRPAVVVVKAVNPGMFSAVAGSIGYLLLATLRNRTDWRAAVAGAVVAGEALVYAASGWRCPLTGVAEQLGADDGSVADICLPGWVASHLPQVTIPLVGAAVVLHARNLWRQAAAVAQGADLRPVHAIDERRLEGVA